MKQTRAFLFLLGLAGAAAAQTTSIDTIVANLSRNLDKISTCKAESRIVQWFA